MFVYGPELLMVGSVTQILPATVTALFGVTALAAAAVGYARKRLGWWERAVALVAALLLVYPDLLTDGAGLLAFAVVFLRADERDSRHTAAP